LMKSLFRLFAVSCTYCSAAVGALTPVNNTQLFGPGPRWAKRSEVSAVFRKSNSELIAMPSEQICFSGRTRETASLIFQRHPAEKIGTNGSAGIRTRWRERSAEG
jgi:hypothetical protein